MSERVNGEFEEERMKHLSAEWWILVMFVVAAAVPWLVAVVWEHLAIVGQPCIGLAIFAMIVYAVVQDGRE